MLLEHEARQLELDIDRAVAAHNLTLAEALAADYCRRAGGSTPTADPARTPWFRARYFAAQMSLAAGRLGHALLRLEPLLPEVSRLSAELAARVRLLAAEALARLGRVDAAREQLHQVPADPLQRFPLLHLRTLRVRLLLEGAETLTAALTACADDLQAGGETANLALLLCEEGRAWDRTGDLTRAERCWRQAEELSQPLGADPIRANVLVQLGRLDHLRGHLARALDTFDMALRIIGPGAQRLELELRRLLVRLELQQQEHVRAEADRLLTGLEPDQVPEEVAPLVALLRGLLEGSVPVEASDETRAYLAALRGEESAARSLYALALAANPSPERRARLVLALGLLALGQGHAGEATAWLRQAEELARTLHLPETLARTLQVCGQMAAEQSGDDALARRFFEEALLLAEVQAGLFRSAVDRAAYRSQRGSVLCLLLRSACRRGNPTLAFRYLEQERGRLLLELLASSDAGRDRLPLFARPAFVRLQQDVAECESRLNGTEPAPDNPGQRAALLERRGQLLLARDRLFEDFLRERSRTDGGILPPLPEITDLQKTLPLGSVYLAPVLVEEEAFLLAVPAGMPARVVRVAGSAATVREQLAGLRGCFTNQIARYRCGLLGRRDREELDQRLDDLGQGPFGCALAEALSSSPDGPGRLYWAPDASLHGLPIHAVRRQGRYLVEDWEIVQTFSAALLVGRQHIRPRRGFWGPAVAVAEDPAVLPQAEREARGVLAAFLRGKLLSGPSANRRTVRRWLARARVAHFACHAEFDAARPLAACLCLPSKETIHALEWLDEPVAGLPLVVLSACRSAEVAPLLGQEVFGLVTGLLGGGVRAVLAGLWPVADRETLPLMWRFYRERLVHDLATSLARAQRETLAAPDASPLFWAAFALFGDADALPARGPCWRWLGRWMQRRHARRFSADRSEDDKVTR